MKVRVKTIFMDKITKVTYEPNAIIDMDGDERIKDCTERGLIEVIEEPNKPKKAPAKKAK